MWRVRQTVPRHRLLFPCEAGRGAARSELPFLAATKQPRSQTRIERADDERACAPCLPSHQASGGAKAPSQIARIMASRSQRSVRNSRKVPSPSCTSIAHFGVLDSELCGPVFCQMGNHAEAWRIGRRESRASVIDRSGRDRHCSIALALNSCLPERESPTISDSAISTTLLHEAL
jgi:hypothetical protein